MGFQAKPSRHEPFFTEVKSKLHEQCQGRGGDCSFEYQIRVVQADSCDDRLSVSASTDQRPQSGESNVQNRRRFDASQDAR